MTRDRDIERVLDRFYAEGPSVMPDRLYLGVFDRIDRVPQRRLAGLLTRFHAMQPNTRLAAAAAAIVAIAGIGALSVWLGPSIGTGPSPSPSATASARPSGGPLDNALQHYWIGQPRSIPGLVPAPNFAGVRLTSSSMQFDGGSTRPARDDFSSSVSMVGVHQLRFVLGTPVAGCAKGDAGTYGFALSPGAGFLSLTAGDDACAARSHAISGDWVKSQCPDSSKVCLGPLEVGDHVSVGFNPFVPIDRWTFSYGRLGYTVPAGWSNEEEDRALYVLARQDRGEDASIWLLSEVAAHDQAPDCSDNVAAAGVGRTEAALATWLTTVPGLKATTATPVTLGGLTGVTTDLSVDPAWTRVCPGGSEPAVKVFADANRNEHDVEVDASAPLRVFLFDLGDGRTLLVFIHAVDRATWDGLVNDAMPIIQSFRFTR